MENVSCADVEDSWDQIGKRLRDARDRAELTVDDVVFRTRIPRTIVDALEAEDFSVFTSPTYAKSFLRQYSEFLNVDADPWLNALEPASYVSGESWQPMFAVGEDPVPPKRDGRKQEQESGSTAPSKLSALWVMLLTGALIVVVVKGYQVFEKKFAEDERPKPLAAPQEISATKQAPTVAQPKTADPVPPGEVKKEEEQTSVPRAIIVRD